MPGCSYLLCNCVTTVKEVPYMTALLSVISVNSDIKTYSIASYIRTNMFSNAQ